MQISERSVGDVIILDLDGRLVVEDGVTPFIDRMNALVRHGRKKILLNFEGVTYLDSSGVGAVVWKYVTARKQDASVKLLNLTRRSHNVLMITKLLTVLETFDSEQQAIDSFVDRIRDTDSEDDSGFGGLT
jgi:anti-sigma B factor antagonist